MMNDECKIQSFIVLRSAFIVPSNYCAFGYDRPPGNDDNPVPNVEIFPIGMLKAPR